MLMLYMSLIETEEEKNTFRDLYNEYEGLMFWCAKQILNDDMRAEDAVHEAFIKIVKYLNRISDVKCRKTKSFVVIVVENTAKDIYRKEKRREYIDLEKMEKYGYCFQPYREVEFTETEKAILELPAIYHHVFQLKYICGYSNAEIADILKIKQSTVRKRISRGKELLAEILKGKGVYVDEESSGK